MPSIDANRILVWLTNLLAASAITFVGYFFAQFRNLETKVATHDQIIVELPFLRQREVSMEKEIAELRAADNTKLSVEEHLRYRDQMEQQHIENLKAVASLQDRISNLPKEFPPPLWFIDQFNDMRAQVKSTASDVGELKTTVAVLAAQYPDGLKKK